MFDVFIEICWDYGVEMVSDKDHKLSSWLRRQHLDAITKSQKKKKGVGRLFQRCNVHNVETPQRCGKGVYEHLVSIKFFFCVNRVAEECWCTKSEAVVAVYWQRDRFEIVTQILINPFVCLLTSYNSQNTRFLETSYSYIRQKILY